MATGEATLERLRFNKSGSKLVGPDSDSLLEQLQSFMKQNIMKDSDFYNLLVMPLVRGGVTEKLTKEVFIEGLHRLGYSGPPIMLVTLFKKIDSEYARQHLATTLRPSCH